MSSKYFSITFFEISSKCFSIFIISSFNNISSFFIYFFVKFKTLIVQFPFLLSLYLHSFLSFSCFISSITMYDAPNYSYFHVISITRLQLCIFSFFFLLSSLSNLYISSFLFSFSATSFVTSSCILQWIHNKPLSIFYF